MREAVVVTKEDALGGQYIWAYIASSVSDPDAAQLRKQLGKILPAYMQPSF
ncbi:hypothetical protein [Pseudomonas syringae group genomosp. 7]|uniref:hypothetical protein n=1 Tax=Pseudomonas syringae group genomosp. 7 TaxID=251699 RepID=UPI0037704872